MARRLSRLVSILLSASLFVLSFGLDAQTAAAQTLSARAVPATPAPQIGLGSALTPTPSFATPSLALSAPSLLAPSLVVAPVVAPTLAAVPLALKPAAPAAAVAEALKAAAPALKALSKPETAGAAAAGAGRDLESVLTGARSAASTGEVPEVAGVESARTPSLSPSLSAAAAPEAPKADAVPAAAPATFKTIATASYYRLHRAVLKAVAQRTGAVYTLPQAAPALTAKIIASASEKQLVLSDFDDTLAGYNEVLPAQKDAAITAIREAGKHFAVISDRGDTKRPGATQLTVFESLESIPVSVRAGMYVAANSGGKVYRYDDQGVPQKVHEATGLTPEQIEQVKAAAAATKARLSEVGAVQHAGDEKAPAESFNAYGYALMLKPGSSQDAVKGAARLLNEELAKRGFEVEVQPRFAKDPANPPYTTFSIITKAEAAAYIAKALSVEAKDALVIGDAMFIPRDAAKASWLTRLGEKLSGRPQVKTGNETDRNMAKLLPGVLTLGVGGAMDPRVPNGWALDGRGPDVTQKVLEAVASRSSRPRAGISARYLALEAKYASELSKIPGVVSIVAEDKTSFYGGDFNSTDGKILRVTFVDAAALQAASAALPAELPALAGERFVAKYTVSAVVEKGERKAAYSALEAKYASELAKVPGVVSVKVEDSTSFYGGDFNPTDGKILRVTFADAPALQAGKASLPETLAAIDGVRDVAKYAVVAVVEKTAKREAYRALETKYAAELSAIPGVVAVKIEDTDFYWGGNLNDSDGKRVRVTFADAAALEAAKAALPATLPAIDGIKDVSRYNVVASVAEKNDGSRAETLIQLGLLAAVVAMAGVGFYVFAHAIAEIVALGEQAIRESLHDGPDLFMLGAGALGVFGMLGVNRDRLGNPNESYAKALKRATEIAVELGATAADVRFLEATASTPVRDGARWKYAFSVPGSLIYVDFSTFMGGEQDARTSVYRGAQSPAGVVPAALSAEQFASLVVLDAEHAGLLLRNELKGFGAGASVSLAARAAADGNGAQMAYKLYDDHGSEGTVGAAGAFVRVDKTSAKADKAAAKAAAKLPGLTTAVEPNELYSLALANMREAAVKNGDSPDQIQFLSAVHEARTFNGAWIGDEWRFFFASGGVRYKVPARRTMVTETMMDAFAPERVGLTERGEAAQGVAARMFDAGVTVSPESALRGVDGVTRLSLLARTEPVSGDKDLWYSLQSGGSEVASVNARTGEIRKPSAVPAASDSKLKSFLIWLAGMGLVALVYGGFYWAMGHAPAAVPQGIPEGYNGPIPSIDEVFRGMGGFLGLGLVAGTLKRAKKAKVTDDEIRAAVASVVSSKGRPWSQTEYNVGYYTTLESLKARGATKKQIALYEKLCADAPIKGGSFNPWSGD